MRYSMPDKLSTWASAGTPYGATGSGPVTSWPSYSVWTWPLLSAPVMSLVANTPAGYTYVGSSQTLSVTPGSNLLFMMNDAFGGHYDNTGALSINYSCQ